MNKLSGWTRRAFLFFAFAAALHLCVDSVEASSVSATLLGAPPRNFLRNGAFDDADFWILKGPQTAWVAAEGRHGGAVRMSEHGAAGSEIVQTIGPLLEPGKRYTLSAWVRALSEGAVAVIGARWEGGYPRVFRGVDPEDGWVRVEFRFEAPKEPGWRQVVLSGTGALVWDDVGLYESETLEAQLAADWERRLSSDAPVYTGLVVNGLGTQLERGMNPKIYDEEGRLLFAGMGAEESQIFKEGIVAYATDLPLGTSHARLNVSDAYPLRLPLVVDAQGARGLPRTDAVIGAADAELIREAIAQYDFLGRFAIVFVVQPFSGL